MRIPLALKGLYWRRGTSIAILLTAAVTTGAAALGPLYAMASTESTLRDQLTGASSSASGLDFEKSYDTDGLAGSATELLAGTLKQTPGAGAINGYPRAIEGMFWETGASALASGPSVASSMVWRSGDCSHLVLVQGRCPTSAKEAMVSKRSVDTKGYGWKIGASITVDNGQDYTVVGVYDPKNVNDRYWFGQNYFDAAPGTLTTPDRFDSIFVAKSGFAGLLGPETVRTTVDYPLDPSELRLADIPRLKKDVATLTARKATPGHGSLPHLTTGLSGVLKLAAHEQQLVDTGTLLVTLQLTLLGWFVLFQVVADAVESRGSEIALAKLRGHSVLRTLRFGLGEPLVLLVVAIPIGGVIAIIAANAFAATVLVPGTPVQLTWATLAAALAAFAGGLIAAGLAARRVLVRSVLEQWRRTTSSRAHARPLIILDIVVAAAAIAGLIVLRVVPAGGDNTVALIAPGLLVLAVGLVGTGLMPLVVRTVLPRTRATGAVSVFIATRQVVRRPAGLRLAALLAVAMGLATFGVGAESVALSNRTARANAEVGASQAISFEYSGVDPISAIRKADPDGRWAMAAATWLPDGGNSVSGSVLAVDATRLAKVGYDASGGESSAQLAAALAANTVPAIVLHATSIRATISGNGLTTNAVPQVQFNLLSPRGGYINAESTLLQTGTHDYTAKIDCADGCIFLGITWDRPITTDDDITGRATVTAMAAGTATLRPINARVTTPGAWHAGVAQGIAKDHVTITRSGVVDNFSSSDGGYGAISYAYLPATIPAVATPKALTRTGHPNDTKTVVDNFGAVAPFTVVSRVSVLPKVLDDGVIMNLRYLEVQLADFDSEAVWQVWLSPSAPSDAVARLTAAGLDVQSTSTAAARTTILARQGPALSLLLLLASAVAGSVLAIGGTAISIGSAARRRSYEAAALGTIGVSRSQLYRAALYEQAIVLGTAIVLGVIGGIAAAILTLPIVPEFASMTPVQLSYAPPAIPIVVTAIGFMVLVLGAAAATSAGVLRGARAGRLREAEE